jgi:aldose 1-epimerase
MIVRTTEPGVQLYVGTHLGGIAGKRGARYAARTGFCLEAQHFPDSPNRPDFPSTRLAPGETYRQTTEYVFPAA